MSDCVNVNALHERDKEGERQRATCKACMRICAEIYVWWGTDSFVHPFTHACMFLWKDRQAGRQANRERENLVQQKIILFISISIYLLWTLAEIKFCWNCIRFKRFLLPPSVETMFFKMCRAQHCCRWRCVLLSPQVLKPFPETFWLLVRESGNNFIQQRYNYSHVVLVSILMLLIKSLLGAFDNPAITHSQLYTHSSPYSKRTKEKTQTRKLHFTWIVV